MNLREKQNNMKDEIKTNFLTLFKAQYAKNLATWKFKKKKIPNKYVCEYDKCIKDLLIHILYTIDENLLVQWYMARLLQKIYGALQMHEIKTRK